MTVDGASKPFQHGRVVAFKSRAAASSVCLGRDAAHLVRAKRAAQGVPAHRPILVHAGLSASARARCGR